MVWLKPMLALLLAPVWAPQIVGLYARAVLSSA
jgi:hypothetical protein